MSNLSMKWSNEIVDRIVRLSANNVPVARIHRETGVPLSTIRNILNRYENNIEVSKKAKTPADTFKEQTVDLRELADGELVNANADLARKVQRFADSNRLERKTFRENARASNMIESLHDEMVHLLTLRKFNSPATFEWEADKDAPIGVIQLSDVHFNELIPGVDENLYDFRIAAARVAKHFAKSAKTFKANGVGHVLVAMTGDLLNSDRRLDEVTNAATNRSQAVFLAVDIIQQAMRFLMEEGFKVTVATVTGNESRVGEHIHWTDLLASDSYDVVIHNMLTWLFLEDPRIDFVPITDPLECVVELNGTKLLLIHGHGHKGLSRTSNLESEVEKIKARYGARGIRIGYVICGHIHQTYVSDMFSRSGGMPGANCYSAKGLNLNSRASQNAYIFHRDGSVDGFKHDLQEFGEFLDKIVFDKAMMAFSRGQRGGTYTIQTVLI